MNETTCVFHTSEYTSLHRANIYMYAHDTQNMIKAKLYFEMIIFNSEMLNFFLQIWRIYSDKYISLYKMCLYFIILNMLNSYKGHAGCL